MRPYAPKLQPRPEAWKDWRGLTSRGHKVCGPHTPAGSGPTPADNSRIDAAIRKRARRAAKQAQTRTHT